MQTPETPNDTIKCRLQLLDLQKKTKWRSILFCQMINSSAVYHSAFCMIMSAIYIVHLTSVKGRCGFMQVFLVNSPSGEVWMPFLACAVFAISWKAKVRHINFTIPRSKSFSPQIMKTCSGVRPAVGSLTDSKIELELPGSTAGAPGNAGKSSLDIWNSDEWSAGCFTIPTKRRTHF